MAILFRDSSGNLFGVLGPAVQSLLVGFDETVDAGTTADYFVDGSVTPSGSTYETVQDAVDAAVLAGGEKTIMVKDTAVYRELVDLDDFQGTITGYGTDKPLITGQEALTGWTQCDSGDEARVGANYANIYKVDLADTATSSFNALNLYEGDTPIPICQARPDGSDLYHPTFISEFDRADAFVLNGSNKITGITDASILTGASSGDLVSRAFVYLYIFGNTYKKVNITAFSGTTVDVDGLWTVMGNTPTPAADNLRWNLVNYLHTLQAGTYGYWDNGDETVTVYCWPNDTASLASDMSYAARVGVFTAPGASQNITLKNLRIKGAGGSGSFEGYCFKLGTLTGESQNITVHNCDLGQTSNDDAGYGVIIARYTDGLTISNNRVSYASGSYGIFQQGGQSLNSTDTIVTKNEIFRISSASMRVVTTDNVQWTFNNMRDTGRGGHTNSWNGYEGTNKFLVYGNFSHDTVGYGTWQGASDVYVGCNVFQTNILDIDSRALVDQSSVTDPPQIAGTTFYVWNNDLIPHNSNMGGNSLTLGHPWNSAWGGSDADHPYNVPFVMLNNVVHGGGISEPYEVLGAGDDRWDNRPGYGPNHIEAQRDGNVYTALSTWQVGSAPYNWSAAAGETVETTIGDVYTDAVNDDFTCPEGSPLLTATGVSLAGTIAAASAIWPSFDFTKDRDGNTINTTTPKIGALHGDRNAQTLAMWT